MGALSAFVPQSAADESSRAAQFQVTVDFLLQQVAYITERHASQVRAQMRKATALKGSNAPSPIPGGDHSTSAAAGGESMRRTASGGGRGSAMSVRKDSTPLRPDASIPGTPGGTSGGRTS